MKSTQRVPARLRPYNRFRQCGLLFQQFSRWVHVIFFVIVHVESRIGHFCCGCVVRLLEAQVVDDASCARSRAWREHIIHCFVTLEPSRDESCSDSVFSAVQIPACRHSLLPESNVQVHGLIHSQICESGRVLQFGIRPSSALSRKGSSNSSVFVTVDVLCRVLILSSRYRDSCHRHTPNVHLRAFPSIVLCLWRHVQCRGFSC